MDLVVTITVIFLLLIVFFIVDMWLFTVFYDPRDFWWKFAPSSGFVLMIRSFLKMR